MKLYQKLNEIRSQKENKKGFTLVELIVVIVILAILAAILVPALLGYIDRAKESQYELEAKSVLMAAQAEASEMYAKNSTEISKADLLSKLKEKNSSIQDTADVEDLLIVDVTPETAKTDASATDKAHASYTISGMTIQFTSSKDKYVECKLVNGTWECGETTKTPAGGSGESDDLDE